MSRTDFCQDTLRFLQGGGTCGALARATDWTRTPLGPPERWQQSLKTTVAILLNSRHPMFLWWGPELIQIYNDAYLPSFGVGKHPKAMGQRGADCWPEIWPIIWPQIDDVMQRGKPSWHEDALVPIFRNGRIEDVYWTYGYSPVLDDDGAMGGTLVVCTETTQRVILAKKLEAEQEASAELTRRLAAETASLRSLFRDAPGFMCVLRGPDHVFELANASYMRLIGQRPVLGLPVREALPEAPAQVFDLLDAVYSTGEPYIASNFTISLPDPGGNARARILDFVYQPIRNYRDEVTGIFVEGIDVTERAAAEAELRRSEEALRRADQSKDEFLAMLAHELRNPLAPLRNTLYIMRMAAGNAPDRLVEMMERQVNHLVRLVDDLLEVSRITSGKIELRKQCIDLAEIVRNAVDAGRSLVEGAGHALEMTLPDEPLPVEGDPVRLAQVVTNLLNNAARYTDRGGRIEVKAARREDCAVISVHDSGIGIEPLLLPKVFDMYMQAPLANDRQREGLGIGLALVKRLVQMHGGTVNARSKGLGSGSEFSVSLPLAASSAHPGSTAGASPAVVEARRILVVDDNRDAAESLAILLGMLGTEVRVVNDGPTALDTVDSYQPAVVLLDVGMPGMNGYEVARALRQRKSMQNAVLVALTGFGSESDREKARQAGFDHHLVKPVDPNALIALIG